jgi:hypothetical protein
MQVGMNVFPASAAARDVEAPILVDGPPQDAVELLCQAWIK